MNSKIKLPAGNIIDIDDIIYVSEILTHEDVKYVASPSHTYGTGCGTGDVNMQYKPIYSYSFKILWATGASVKLEYHDIDNCMMNYNYLCDMITTHTDNMDIICD